MSPSDSGKKSAFPRIFRSSDEVNTLWNAAHRPQRSTLGKILLALWTFIGLTGLIFAAWPSNFVNPAIEQLLSGLAPYSAGWLAVKGFQLLAMIPCGIVLVEAIGYFYHRFWQHLGQLTRRFKIIRRNQQYHWRHHMIIYPYGKGYIREVDYASSEQGIPWSWAVPTILVMALAVYTIGFSLATLVLLLTIGYYAKFVIDLTHARFHVADHPWKDSKYFHWLADIHILHHWDQRYNYTIVHPLMDMIFGTYLSPKLFKKEIAACNEQHTLTASDLVNWIIMLREARPEERAAYVSNAGKHRPSQAKLAAVHEILEDRLKQFPTDSATAKLEKSAAVLMELVGIEHA